MIPNGTEKKYPKYKGTVQDENVSPYTDIRDKVGKITIWDNLEPTNEKSPLLTGTIEVTIPEINATRKYRIALWKFEPREQ